MARTWSAQGQSETLQEEPQERIDAGTLFRRHAAFVASFLARIGIDRPELDDVVQEVFMIAHRRGGFQAGPARPTTWLADIAIRVAANRRRARRRARVAPDEEKVARQAAGDPTPVEAIDARRSLDRVQRALEAVDEDKRAVFVLYELEGESCEAIAAGLGIPIGTVYSRLHAARKKFTRAYERLRLRERPVGAALEVTP
jgi:RNA polymerase sigma-70 factor (ECF subfamily)